MIKFNDNIIEVIFGFTMLFGLIAMIVWMIRLRNNHIKSLKEIGNKNPHLKEKVRIVRSRQLFSAEKNKKTILASYKGTIIFFIIFILIIVIAYKLKSNPKTLVCILLGMAIIFITYIKKRDKKLNEHIKEYLKDKLIKQYGALKEEPVNSYKEIVYGSKSEVGNIRNVQVFSFKILKFKCILKNYYQERLTEQISNSEYSHYDYRYIKIRNVLEYYYNLNKLGITNINQNILESDKLQRIIQNLTETKIIRVSIKDEYLLVEKETVLFNYEQQDADRDANDVELFYNTIIKGILEENQ